MNLRVILLLFLLVSKIFRLGLMYISTKHRALPLPEEVSDIYNQQKYQEFLSYKKDYQLPEIIKIISEIVLGIIMLFTPFFYFIESISYSNIYLTFVYTYLIITIISYIIDIPIHYYETFVIETRYGKNKKTFQLFLKDELIDLLMDLLLGTVLYILLIFIIEKIIQTIDFSHQSLPIVFCVMGCLLLIGFIVYLLLLGISYFYLHLQYKFKPLEDEHLLSEINRLMLPSKKKVKIINVYNESSKSTSKNAFLLKILGHREFGIADNFLDGHSENELLAVLSHEIGHLMHKKNIYNYIQYLQYALAFLLLVVLMLHPQWITQFITYCQHAFNLTTHHYYVYLFVISTLFSPIALIINIFHNYVSRLEEYEADDNAIKNGYAEDLIHTFKQLSSDELIDVNPSPIIEFIEYDHPGMYQRIKHLKEGQ